MNARFRVGEWVRKKRGSQWHGKIVGTYSTDLTPEGYCVESATESGSVQIYPVGALELWLESSSSAQDDPR
jgi:dihydrofolate reductase (trimethoprim resistance protein)